MLCYSIIYEFISGINWFGENDEYKYLKIIYLDSLIKIINEILC